MADQVEGQLALTTPLTASKGIAAQAEVRRTLAGVGVGQVGFPLLQGAMTTRDGTSSWIRRRTGFHSSKEQ